MEITVQQTCDQLLSLIEWVKNYWSTAAESHGLTRAQLYALYTIYRENQLAMGQVATVLHCDASNVTGIVDRLVAQKLVVRTENPEDRRAKTLRLTAKGKQVIQTIKAALPAALGCTKLSQEERRQLQAITEKLLS